MSGGAPFEFRALGSLEVIAGDRGLVQITSPLQRVLLLRLMIAAGSVVSADRLADDLWGAEQPENPANSLRYHVWQLRDLLEPDRKERSEGRFIRTKAPGYYLDLGDAVLDTIQFQQLVASGRFSEASELWRGEPMLDAGDREFAEQERRRLVEMRLSGFESYAEEELAEGRGEELLPQLQEFSREHPYREALRGHLMVALYRAGRQGDALAAYREARDLLGEELGIEPSPELKAIEEQVLLQDGDLAPSSRTESLLTIPAALTSFIGRESLIEDVEGKVGQSRLVTLLGPPGVGKTRLAMELARRWDGADTPSVWVDLVAVRDRHGLVEAVARALRISMMSARDFRDIGSEALEEAVRLYLRQFPILLFLDNCEQVAAEVAAFTFESLRSAEQLRVIATSRERLRVTGEVVVEVPALTGSQSNTWDRLISSESGRLFVERSNAAGSHIPATSEMAAAIAELCVRLDGLPLAIELAAARSRSMPPRALLDHLEDRFDLLGMSTGATDWHSSLVRALEWSYDLLDPDEAAAFRALSIFSGGFGLEAAAVVVGAVLSEDRNRFDLVGRLVDKSLIASEVGPEGDQRFHMLESVREFAAKQLQLSGDHSEVQDAFVSYVIDLGRITWDPEKPDQDRKDAALQLDMVSGDLQPSLESLVDVDPCGAVALAGALWPYWRSRSEATAALRIFRRIGDACPEADAGDRARFLGGWVGVETLMGGAGSGQELWDLADRAAAVAEKAGLWYIAAEALILGLGWFGFDEWAADRWGKAVDIYRKNGDRMGDLSWPLKQPVMDTQSVFFGTVLASVL